MQVWYVDLPVEVDLNLDLWIQSILGIVIMLYDVGRSRKHHPSSYLVSTVVTLTYL